MSDIITDKLSENSTTLVNQILPETDLDKTKSIINLFNLNETKKNMIRVNKLNEVQDCIVNQMLARLTTQPNNFSTDDLVKMMKTVQDALEKSNNQINSVDTIPAIQITQNTLNVTNDTMSKESRDKVMNAVKLILSKMNSEPEDRIIEGDYSEGE